MSDLVNAELTERLAGTERECAINFSGLQQVLKHVAELEVRLAEVTAERDAAIAQHCPECECGPGADEGRGEG